MEAEFRGTRRFAICRRLGAGGMGVVYEAFDRDKQVSLALKTLRRPSPDAILRLAARLMTPKLSAPAVLGPARALGAADRFHQALFG